MQGLKHQRIYVTFDIPGNNRVTLEGRSFGALPKENGVNGVNGVIGEMVFQTGMVGYPESLSDPSYYDQILVLTYPLIGSYGIPNTNTLDEYGIPLFVESDKVHVKALIVGEYIHTPSHYQSAMTLHQYLADNNVPGIEGIDTRYLTELIREHGTLRGMVSVVPPVSSFEFSKGLSHLAQLVCRQSLTFYNDVSNFPEAKRILVVDCGIKNNQLRMLLTDPKTNRSRNTALVVVGVSQIEQEGLESIYFTNNCKSIFISNGPGDPRDCAVFIEQLSQFMKNEKNAIVPIFGICLGHQLLALAAKFDVCKLKYGNRGHNQPCKLIGTNRTFQTTQNHGYAVVVTEDSDWSPLFVNLNDKSNEGLRHAKNRWFSVQFHPEAKAGPEDTSCLFDVFLSSKEEQHEWPYFERTLFPGALVTTAPKEYSKVLVLGSGGLCIGQSGEFDYSGSQAIKAFKEDGLVTVLINPNIATVQTTPGFADRIYFLPVTPEFVERVIEVERPDCIALSFGGQTALNCGILLKESGILEKYGVDVLGTPVESIVLTEDREHFKKHIQSIGESIPDGAIAQNIDDAIAAAKRIGYPLLVRAAFTLGGQGSGFANTEDELRTLLQSSFALSNQVIIDKSFRGWKEIEYEIVRDRFGNCISVCNMENFDPLGVHTGESIVVAPSQTLSDEDYNRLRSTAIKTVSSLNIVGECNIQYAVDPMSSQYYIIEINARLSRSSALASKATGYPLAYIAAKLGLGYGLDQLKNNITGNTTACFEPSLDYCVVKIPRWDLIKFQKVNTHIGSAMKSVGEGMAISRSFEEALQSALRMTGMCRLGLQSGIVECTDDELRNPTYRRILAVATGLATKTYTIEQIHALSGIDRWFLEKIERIVSVAETLKLMRNSNKGETRKTWLHTAKKLGFSDEAIAYYIGSTELVIRSERIHYDIKPSVKQIDTVAAEFPCCTNYLYTTYATTPATTPATPATTSTTLQKRDKILVLGSGVYHIGSSVEFDWCSVSCIRELRRLGKEVIVVNCNPETVSTDYDEADSLYFTEVSLETVLDIYETEHPTGVIVSVGGQLPNNIAMKLHLQGVPIIGTSPENIDNAENRKKFSRLLDRAGIDQPLWKELDSVQAAITWSQEVSYPVLVRPSYVLSGAAMNVAYSDNDLKKFLGAAVQVSQDHPVVISKFISDAKEIEVDAVADHGNVKYIAVSEHVENAGVHSGDATLIFPAQDLTEKTTAAIKEIAYSIARILEINGPFNIQFIAKDDKIKVIECNLRVSRSFPFVSKTMGINFVSVATAIMVGLPVENIDPPPIDRVGVKVAQFSFNRLTGAEILLGVEMQSTGEVACFSSDYRIAYLKALIASGFLRKIPERGAPILISIGGYLFKKEFRQSISILRELGYDIYATRNTANYYNIPEMRLHSSTRTDNIMNWIAERRFAIIINITERNKMRCVEDEPTSGYYLRQAAIQHNVPIVTDIKAAKLLINGLRLLMNANLTTFDNIDVDCFGKNGIVRIPGLIDVHVHVREPGHTHKEDWKSCTKAALAGGVTMICAMPNTKPELLSDHDYDFINRLANEKARCDYALFAGASSTNTDTVATTLADKVAGLKMYLNLTTGDLLLSNTIDWMKHIAAWNHPDHPICVHAEGQTLAAVLHIASIYQRRIHVCHVARKEEILLIWASKAAGHAVTCEVAPHHLFLTAPPPENDEKLLWVKPCLQTKEDQDALWANMDIIDCFATDHAPHTIDDKCTGCHGFPGLETALPLLLTAVNQGRLTLDDIVLRYNTNPRKIFNLPEQPDTYVEIDMKTKYVLPQQTQYCRSKWTPFAGFECMGAIKRVVLRGKTMYVSDRPMKGKIFAKPGSASNVRLVGIHHPIQSRLPQPPQQPPQIPGENDDTQRSPFVNQDILSADQFTKDNLRILFERADSIRKTPNAWNKVMKGKRLGLFFYEASTRTRVSFETAMTKLGGDVIHISAEQSSVKKGETLEDSIVSFKCCGLLDAIVLRHPQKGSAQRAANVSDVPIINAGDGDGEHPTQTLIDLYTIRRELGTIAGICVVFIGDLRYGRTVHSLVKALALRNNVRLHFVSPKELQLPDEISSYITERGIVHSNHTELSDDVLSVADVLYVTRIQRERHEKNYDQDPYCITPAILAKTKPELRVLHPLPRESEISLEVDNDPRAAYKRQMENGPYIRMALLTLILKP